MTFAPDKEPVAPLGMASMRPTAGARFAFERAAIEPTHVAYEGFVHLPDLDIPLKARVALPGGAVTVTASPVEGVPDDRSAELVKLASQLLRAATKAEASAGEPLPRKIVRWRGA